MQGQTSIRLLDVSKTLPSACLFSAAFCHRSISTGKERDAESGNDYFGARYYSSMMGRFLSADPSNLSVDWWLPQTWNRYTYGQVTHSNLPTDLSAPSIPQHHRGMGGKAQPPPSRRNQRTQSVAVASPGALRRNSSLSPWSLCI